MNILLINQDWFAPELKAAGHSVMSCGIAGHLDLRLETPLLHIDTIIGKLPGSFVPDVLVVLDNSAPVMLTGLEESDIPTLFYSVDTHHHVDLHKYLFNMFDGMLIAQKDYSAEFEALGYKPEWFPLWASRYVEPSTDKKHDIVFVGTMNEKLNPERVKFFNALAKLVPIHCTMGEYWNIFPFSDIVVNQTVKGDLNFRVFEAMMCGTMLLTENSGNGLLELFKNGTHLVTYEKNNVENAAQLIRELLDDRRRCREIARAGRDEILNKHTPQHRAERLLQIINQLTKRTSSMKFFAAMMNFSSLSRRFAGVDTALTARALVAAMKAAEYGLKHGEKINDDIACYLVLAALRYDQMLGSCAGRQLLGQVREAHPETVILSLAEIRTLLNDGKRVEAEAIAQRISTEDVYKTFISAETVVGNLLAQGYGEEG